LNILNISSREISALLKLSIVLEGRSEVDFPPEVIEGVVSVEEMASPPDDWHGPEFGKLQIQHQSPRSISWFLTSPWTRSVCRGGSLIYVGGYACGD
jgi:hypothetical protein